jgi:Xaa-Pro aminopeptidase
MALAHRNATRAPGGGLTRRLLTEYVRMTSAGAATRRPDWALRLGALTSAVEAQRLDGLVVSSLINIRYLSGFEATAGLLVLTPTQATLLVDGRYEALARTLQESGAIAPVRIARITGRYDTALVEMVRQRQLRRVGVEATDLSLATFNRWREGLGPDVVLEPTTGLVERQRAVKDAGEIETLRRAALKLSAVAVDLTTVLRAGRTERDVAGDIDLRIRREGFSKPAFETIVASGPNGAYPHARPTDRTLRNGDLLVLDFGGVLDGYCVDLTRAAAVGRITDEAYSLYRAVKEAQDAAIRAIRPGVKAADVDRAAREVLKSQGFGDYFVHGTGHGLGLEVHEAPHVSPGEPGTGESLEAGMVATVEPGVYVEGLGGVRLEDDVLVTREGSEVLTTAPRDLLVV